jgi:acetyltransferase-like isoleucine patch superfamily enzyme
LLKKLWRYAQENETVRILLAKIYNFINLNKKSIKGIGNKVNHKHAFLKKTSIRIVGNNNSVVIKENSRLFNTNILVMGDNHKIEIGGNCTINNSGFVFEDKGCAIIIGQSTTAEGIQVASVEPGSSILIGDNCMFSADISIRNSDSHSIIDTNTNERINHAKNIVIGNHVWIGEAVRILKGSTIEDNSIVGVGSIVTNHIPHNSVAVGIPARVVKNNINWTRERIPLGG